MSQSPEGSGRDFYKVEVGEVHLFEVVAIPRRVWARFLQFAEIDRELKVQDVAIPRRVWARFLRIWIIERHLQLEGMSQSPEGSGRDFYDMISGDLSRTHSECRNPPKGLGAITTT